MPEWVIDELVIPQSVDDENAADYVTCIEMASDAEAESHGTNELCFTPAETLPWWNQAASPTRFFGVRVDGELLGFVEYETLITDTDMAWVMVHVRAAARRRGIGTALAEHVERLARREGRSRLLAYVPSADGPGERLDAPTGFGSVPRSNPEVGFLLAQGYRLEQVERASRLALPATVTVPTPADYRVHFWIDRTPTEWLEQMAVLGTRMSTDAPSAGLDEPEDVHTVQRIMDVDDAAVSSPRDHLVAAVEHVPSGQLAGFSTLSVPAERDRAVRQYATLVLREHRGQRLGMLLKLANIDQLQVTRPGHPSIITINAEENRFMLDVNEAVGFVGIGFESAWRKDL